MPIFFQQDIDESTKLAIWKIEEDEAFFLHQVPLQREITHPHKRLQHLAGRYLLKFLFPDFPFDLIQIADTRKPFLSNEAYHFSISHCSNYAAAIASRTKRVGVDVEVPRDKVEKIMHKFLHEEEQQALSSGLQTESASKPETRNTKLTLLWSCKEAMFKWWGAGDVDFKSVLRIHEVDIAACCIAASFEKEALSINFAVDYKMFEGLVLAWLVTEPDIHKIID